MGAWENKVNEYMHVAQVLHVKQTPGHNNYLFKNKAREEE